MAEMSGKSGKVYAANVTAQNHTLNFRVPDVNKPIAITIPMGQQKMIGDFSFPAIEAMVEQLGRYGLVELGQESKKEKVTWIFNIGGPVPLSAIQKLYDRNRGILTDEGRERRIAAAAGVNTAMNTEDTPIKNMTIEVEEDDSGDFGNQSDNVGEGFNIDNTANTSENKKPRRSRSRQG